MGLQQEIDEKRKDIYTNKYSISIGELLHLYHDGELDVHPEFQRFLRWDDQQKTDLIESILLGIPIPPIFVAQRTDGVWDVIDGLQRLGTILQFVGVKNCTFPELSASCDSAHEALNEPADFWAQAPY